MKQFLVTTNDVGLRRLHMLLGSDIGFLEVQGMEIAGNTASRILCTPIEQAPVEAMEPEKAT